MPENMEIVFIIIAAVVALAVLFFGIQTIRRDRQAIIDERLDMYTSEYGSQLAELLEEETSIQQASIRDIYQDAVDSALEEREFAKRWKQQLARADLKITPGEFLGLHFVSVIGFFLLGNLISGAVIGVVAGVAGFFAPRIYISFRMGKRLNLFEAQLPDNLQMWVNGLRSGYSVLQAVEAIAKEAPEPTTTEFQRIIREVQLGIPMEEAFAHALERMPSDDFDLVITAVNIQREVGGNLAEILEVISHTVRERIKLKAEIRTMTAQGRITGYIIGGMPLFLLAFLYLTNRSYIERMFTNQTCGWPMLLCGALLIASGTAAIQKIIDIEI